MFLRGLQLMVIYFGVCVSSGRTNPLERGLKQTVLFRELVGCLMWHANQTRPDIANAVRAVARYTNSPREIHWKTAVGILEYVFL